MFGGITYCYILCYMMTVTEFAEKKGVSAATVYSWIYRDQAKRNGFKVIQVGKVKLIKEIKEEKTNRSLRHLSTEP